MNQLPWRRLKPSLQTVESLSRRLVAQWEASAGGLTLQQTGTRANTAGGCDPTRGEQHLHKKTGHREVKEAPLTPS